MSKVTIEKRNAIKFSDFIEINYDRVWDFIDGLARVKKMGEYGFIDKTGNEVIKLGSEAADNFDVDLARVKLAQVKKEEKHNFMIVEHNGEYGLKDKNGNKWSELIYKSIMISDGMIVLDNRYLIDLKNLQRVFTCLATINGETFEAEFEVEEKRDEYYNCLNAYIEGRTGKKDYEIALKKAEIEPLIKKLNEDILSIENDYCEDIKKGIEDYYKKYKMQG